MKSRFYYIHMRILILVMQIHKNDLILLYFTMLWLTGAYLDREALLFVVRLW